MMAFNRFRPRPILNGLAVAVALLAAPPAASGDDSIILQSTTSTANSGLYEHLLPIFEGETGIRVGVVAVGTGQAIRNAANGDGDVLLTHARSAEEKFVAEGFGVERFDVMYNDFVVVGPGADPAGVRAARGVLDACRRIAAARVRFVSRGDDSGTHRKERSLWRQAGIDPTVFSGQWYRETGSGMGTTLNVAAGMDAYALTDRATWISFRNKGDLRILFEGDDALFNQYGVVLVNPERHPNVNAAAAQRFIDWLLGVHGQRAIAAYRLDGRQLFFPNARGS